MGQESGPGPAAAERRKAFVFWPLDQALCYNKTRLKVACLHLTATPFCE